MGLLDFLKRSPRKKQCARCGNVAAHGYSAAAESDRTQITPLCLECLLRKLRHDYEEHHGRALVIEPAPFLPCYVFRDLEYLRSVSADLAREVISLLHAEGQCVSCKGNSSYSWVGSRGITAETFSEVLEKGPKRTLLTWGNPAPVRLCGKCVVDRIGRVLQAGDFEYFEVCSPRGNDDGVVIPMAY